MTLFTMDGAYIKAFGKLQMAQSAVLLNTGKLPLNNWPYDFRVEADQGHICGVIKCRNHRP